MAKDSLLVNVQGNTGAKPRLYATGGVADDKVNGVPTLRLSGGISLYVGAVGAFGAVCYSKFYDGGLCDLIADVVWSGKKAKLALTASPVSVHVRVIAQTGEVLFEWIGLPSDFELGWERILIDAGLKATVGDASLPTAVVDEPVG